MIVSSSSAFGTDSPDRKPEKLILYASAKGLLLLSYKKNVYIFFFYNFRLSVSDSDYTIEIEFDKLPGTFYGTGDAFAAMFLAWFTRLNNDLKVC